MWCVVVEKIFSDYKFALRDALENKKIDKKHIAFLENYLHDSSRFEELIVKELEPYVKELYSSIQQYTQLQSAAVDDLVSDPKNFDELFCEVLKELKPDFFEVDALRKILREKLISYLKQFQVSLLEARPRIELQKLYIDYLKNKNIKLLEKAKQREIAFNALKEKLKGVEVIDGERK